MKHIVVFAAISLSLAVGGAADAGPSKGRLKDRYTKKRRVIKSGKLSKHKKRKVQVAGRGKMRLDKLADEALERPRERARALRKVNKALFGDVYETEDMIETDKETILISTVRARIKDPKQLRKSSAFKDYRKKKLRRTKYEDMASDDREAFDEYIETLAEEPEDDPLRVASEVSPQALLDAIADGQGTIQVITTIIIPIDFPRVVDGGIWMSAWAADGGFDADSEELIPTSALLPPAPQVATVPEATGPTRTGERENTHRFMMGDSITDSWNWSEDWDLPGATVEIRAGAEFGVGLRIPVVVTTTVDPTRIETVDTQDGVKKYKVEVSARAKEAKHDYYADVGLSEGEIQNGEELLFFAKAYFIVEGVTAWYFGSIPFSLPIQKSFDFNDDFAPPLGDCNTSCGPDIWIPQSVSHTGIDVAVFDGGVEFGVNVSGHGTFKVDYRSKVGDNSKESTYDGNQQTKQTLVFDREETHTVRTDVRALAVQNNELEFGYQLDNPRYIWDLVVTPGIRGSVGIDVGVWSHTFNLGPWWLHEAAVDLGSVKLDAHPGTTNSYTRKPGIKTWRKPGQVPLGGD